jgi:hypothetical protein
MVWPHNNKHFVNIHALCSPYNELKIFVQRAESVKILTFRTFETIYSTEVTITFPYNRTFFPCIFKWYINSIEISIIHLYILLMHIYILNQLFDWFSSKKSKQFSSLDWILPVYSWWQDCTNIPAYSRPSSNGIISSQGG